MTGASTQWWIRLSNGKIRGPFVAAKVVRAWRTGQVPADACFGTSAVGPWLPIQQCAAAEVPPTPPPIPQAAWFFVKNGVRNGPLNEAKLKTLALIGDLAIDDLVWTKGMASWSRAGDTPQLSHVFDSGGLTPPPIPDTVPPSISSSTDHSTDGFHGFPAAMASCGEVDAASPMKPQVKDPPSRGGGDDVWAICALALPVVSAGGLWVWMENLRVIDVLQRNPMQTMWMVSALTVIGCGVFVTLDAAKLGIGGPDDLTTTGNRRANGPAHWGLFVAMLFLIGFPSYMAIRSRRGARNYIFVAVLVMSGFVLATMFLSATLSQGMRQTGF